MRRFCISIGISAMSWIGWELGEHIGIGSAMIGCFIGSVAGIWVGWKIHGIFFS